MSICQGCDTPYTISRNSTGKYCSLKCQGMHTSRKIVEKWLNDPTKENYYTGNQVRKAIRRHLIAEADNQCSQCGWDKVHPESELPPLEIDHANGDWTNCSPGNLRVLCPNCHSLTNTYKNRNRGKGRHGRKVTSPSIADDLREDQT